MPPKKREFTPSMEIYYNDYQLITYLSNEYIKKIIRRWHNGRKWYGTGFGRGAEHAFPYRLQRCSQYRQLALR
jgi:hypothetical protein